jgi:starvation-inducible DNA-binding protein
MRSSSSSRSSRPARSRATQARTARPTSAKSTSAKSTPARTPSLNTPQLGLSSTALHKVHDLLNTCLANLHVLTAKTRKMHWDVVGPQFMTLHKVWDEQYTQLSEASDQVAERIRQLNGYPLATLRGFLEQTELQEEPGRIPNATEAVSRLLADHEAIIRSLRQGIHTSDEVDDAGTSDFLTGLLQAHEKMAWILRSFLQGEAIHPHAVTLPKDRAGR